MALAPLSASGLDKRIDGVTWIEDGRAGSAKNDVFALLGANDFSGKKGQLRYETKKGDRFVVGDTNGDRVADFSIAIRDTNKVLSGDFFL